MSLNFIKAWVLIWHFTLVLIKLNYGQIGDQTGLFYTTNPVFYTSGNRFAHRTGTFGNLWFFHLSRRTTVIQDLLVRRQFSLVPDNRTNVNVEVCYGCRFCLFLQFFYFILELFRQFSFSFYYLRINLIRKCESV
jgi:hypothetical protein